VISRPNAPRGSLYPVTSCQCQTSVRKANCASNRLAIRTNFGSEEEEFIASVVSRQDNTQATHVLRNPLPTSQDEQLWRSLFQRTAMCSLQVWFQAAAQASGARLVLSSHELTLPLSFDYNPPCAVTLIVKGSNHGSVQ